MICSKILCVSKKFALLQTTAEMSAVSAHFGTRGEGMTKNCPREQGFRNVCRLAAEMKAGSAHFGMQGE